MERRLATNGSTRTKYDNKIKKLNLELGVDRIGTPLIQLQDWTKKNKSKPLVTLHIKEAIELKAVIDNLVFNYLDEDKDYLQVRIKEKKK